MFDWLKPVLDPYDRKARLKTCASLRRSACRADCPADSTARADLGLDWRRRCI